MTTGIVVLRADADDMSFFLRLDKPYDTSHTVAYNECVALSASYLAEGPFMLEICLLTDLPPGESRRVEADPPIAVFHTEDGEVFAIDDTCSHQDASLADGWLEGCEIECPLHASRFDLRTGAVDAPPAKLPVRTHRVVIEDGVIKVELSTDVPNLPPDIRARLGEAGKP
ncbi:bifunctional 3-phenylpropionate/cinnamic acid dioxygenase ferredoxin subunit [Mycolicibacterium sp. 120320]|uniref:bifunctional 3-phenylpropionate/cinnamic acid dioxygenase ferredoxin subunit n=1 Tax=unclassified Mycolicibacterium TaxID=2636767 RepID=UPI003FA5F099